MSIGMILSSQRTRESVRSRSQRLIDSTTQRLVRLFIVVLLTAAASVCARADEASLQFDSANAAYRANDFQKATVLYEQIAKNGYESPDLYFNLGNAYFKQKNIPAAILNYERARKLAPHDDDILYNLRQANLRIIDKIDPLPTLFLADWWKAFINLFSADGWSLISILALWGTVIGGGLFLISSSFALRRVLSLACMIGACAAVLAIVGVVQRTHVEEAEQNAVVFAQTSSVKSAPDAQSTDLFVIHEGLKVEVLDAVGDWQKVRLADGKIGWISASALQVI
jgi:tetratricopeptide (TPR) repeat protein